LVHAPRFLSMQMGLKAAIYISTQHIHCRYIKTNININATKYQSIKLRHVET